MLFTVKLWTALYKKCLQITDNSTMWRESTVKVVYKGKGLQNASVYIQIVLPVERGRQKEAALPPDQSAWGILDPRLLSWNNARREQPLASDEDTCLMVNMEDSKPNNQWLTHWDWFCERFRSRVVVYHAVLRNFLWKLSSQYFLWVTSLFKAVLYTFVCIQWIEIKNWNI